MNEETDIITRPDPEHGPSNGESVLHGVSIRAWIALVLVFAVCFLQAFGKTVEEPLYSLAVMAVGFYFGQVKTPKAT